MEFILSAPDPIPEFDIRLERPHTHLGGQTRKRANSKKRAERKAKAKAKRKNRK